MSFYPHSEHDSILSAWRLPPGRRGVPAPLQANQDYQYREMERSFRANGGVASADEVTALLVRHTDQPISMLARWIEDAHKAQRAYGLRLPNAEIEINVGAAHRQLCLTALALFGVDAPQAMPHAH